MILIDFIQKDVTESMITNFIFDIDGTLIDTSEMYMPAMIMALADFGYHYSPE